LGKLGGIDGFCREAATQRKYEGDGVMHEQDQIRAVEDFGLERAFAVG
jgi:hypothetical protein